MKKRFIIKKKTLLTIGKSMFWFSVGGFLGLFLFVSFVFIAFRYVYAEKVYPGVMVNGIHFGGKTQKEIQEFFQEKNRKIENTSFTFKHESQVVTVLAKHIEYGYDDTLLAVQAYTIGRSTNVISNISLVFQAYLYGINLPPAYRYSDAKLEKQLLAITQSLYREPIDALFTFQNGKVTAFRPSSDGQQADLSYVKKALAIKAPFIAALEKTQQITIEIPITTLSPTVTTDQVNNLGIKEVIGVGNSQFQGSIQNRIHNVTLAATRINGILIKPNEVFSFNKALGDISSFTGYKQAYVIENGKTVLGDGGGVCQVSTTFFRALLNAGLPIVERHAHAYRVGYYEQDSLPGLDATIFVPNVDLRFKNDTGNHILIQTIIDPEYQKLTFLLYGTKDGRQITVGKPVITSQSPAPATIYQDDPTLPKGTLKQVDFAAPGAQVYFTREVKKDGKVIISDKFSSSYRPWQAIFLRGTKE